MSFIPLFPLRVFCSNKFINLFSLSKIIDILLVTPASGSSDSDS